MKSFSYVNGIVKDLEIGSELCFGQLYDGDGDPDILLDDGSICVGYDDNDMPVIVGFDIVSKSDNILDTVVKITDIY